MEVRVFEAQQSRLGPKAKTTRWIASVWRGDKELAYCCRKNHPTRIDARYCGNRRLSALALAEIKARVY